MIRREFLKNSSFAALGVASSSMWPSIDKPKSHLDNIGLQLYTVRDDMDNNPVATLRKIKGIGYSHVECAGYKNGKFYGQTKENFKRIIDDIGLKMHSGHAMTGFGFPEGTFSMNNHWEQYCEDAAFMGQKYIVSAYFMPDERKTLDDYKKFAVLFNKCAETAKQYNLIFCHHNHDFEFMPIDGKTPYDILLSETDPKMVKFEIDHYWTTKAQVNTGKIIKKHPGRFPLFHIKDMENTPEKAFAEVGAGTINWKKVFNMRAKAGVEFFYVEQDFCTKKTPLESIELSFKYLKNLEV